MNTKIITFEIFGITEKSVVITRDDGSMESFPVDEENPRYQAWVEAGGVA